MNNTKYGLIAACLMLLSGCSATAPSIRTTELIPCTNAKALTTPVSHPARTGLTHNRHLMNLIDQYAASLTAANDRMAAIDDELDDCQARSGGIAP